MRNVAGIGQSEAFKSSDIFIWNVGIWMKWLDGRDCIATGTPISNSMTSLMQRYLQYDDLKARELEHFDAWASTWAWKLPLRLSPEGNWI